MSESPETVEDMLPQEAAALAALEEDAEGEAPSAPDRDYPAVSFPRLNLPLPGAEPKGLGESRPAAEKDDLPPHPKVSVVLYNRDDADRLWNFMFALKSQTRLPDEILLVDNGSTDASVEFLRTNHPEVRVMELEEVFPRAQALNLGFLAAEGDLVALVDLSLALPPEWLRRAVEAFQGRAAKAGAVVCPIVGPTGVESAPVYNVLGRVVAWEAPYPGGSPFGLPPGAVLARRKLFPEGPFEESLPEGPDPFAWGWRLRAFGSDAAWAFDARVLRPAESIEPPPSPFRADYREERRRFGAWWVSTERATCLKLAPLFLADAVARPLGRWFHPGGSFWGSLLGLLSAPFALAPLGRASERLRESRRAGDAAVTAALSGRLVEGDGVFAGMCNAFCAAYLAAAGIPTRESLEKKKNEQAVKAPQA